MLSLVYRAWRRAVRDVGELELWEVLKRRGTRKAANVNPQALAFALERCTVCRSGAECRQMLAAGHDEKIHAFCPNAMYLKHLDAMQRHAEKEDLLAGPIAKR